MKTVLNNTIATALPLSKKMAKKTTTLKASFFALSTILLLMLTSCSTEKEMVTYKRPDWNFYDRSFTPPTFQYEPASVKGVVTDREGNALQDVTILFDNEIIGKTNASGEFSAKSTKRNDLVYNIIAQKEGYNNAVNSYHTKMGEMNYAIQMGKPCKCDSIIIDNFCDCMQPVEINWTNNFTTAESDLLDEIIACLKRNPMCEIKITYFIGDANKQAATPRVEKVKNYMVNKGISENRVHTTVQRNDLTNENKIQIEKR